MRRLAVFLALTALACGGSDAATTMPAPVAVSGAWQLKTVNGASLPFVGTQADSTIELLSAIQFTQTSPFSSTFTGAVVNQTLRLYLGSSTWAYGR
jgi:hypothetical protein